MQRPLVRMRMLSEGQRWGHWRVLITTWRLNQRDKWSALPSPSSRSKAAVSQLHSLRPGGPRTSPWHSWALRGQHHKRRARKFSPSTLSSTGKRERTARNRSRGSVAGGGKLQCAALQAHLWSCPSPPLVPAPSCGPSELCSAPGDPSCLPWKG